MTKIEIVTHLVAAHVTSHPLKLSYISECDVRDAVRVADWILSVEDTRTPEQRAKQELGINVEDCER